MATTERRRVFFMWSHLIRQKTIGTFIFIGPSFFLFCGRNEIRGTRERKKLIGRRDARLAPTAGAVGGPGISRRLSSASRGVGASPNGNRRRDAVRWRVATLQKKRRFAPSVWNPIFKLGSFFFILRSHFSKSTDPGNILRRQNWNVF